MSTAQRDERAHCLLVEAADTRDPDIRRELLHEVIELHMSVARSVAGRYRGRGVPAEDLEQVAFEALTKAVHRFDPEVADGPGSLLSLAVPTIRGEIRRYFRDLGWMVRPLRRVQDLQASIRRTSGALAVEQGRWPDATELADELGVPVEEVHEALSADGCFTPTSLDQPFGDQPDSGGWSEVLACQGADAAFDDVEVRMSCLPVLRELDERTRRVLVLTYLEGLSQRQIGEREGLSQMQVSRIMRAAAQRLRDACEEAA